jgi:alpha-1,2-mannosyltransferase
LATIAVWPKATTTQIDMQIFRFGARQLLTGAPIYDRGLSGSTSRLLFNYSPFAALVFAPLAAVPTRVLQALTPFGNLALLALLADRCWRAVGIEDRSDRTTLVMATTGSLLWLEPVRTTLLLGQVGLLLMAIIIWDLLPRPGERRWQGVGVGIAAGVKLTPLLFIPYLLTVRKTRAAVVAATTFLFSVLIGFAVAPRQAWHYWFDGTFGDLHRIAGVAYVGNASLRGALARLGLGAGPWIALAAVIVAASLIVAAWAERNGEPLLGLTLIGMASTAASPYSWAYHWVWFVPLTIWLAHRTCATRSRTATIALVALLLATLSWPSNWPSAASGQMVRIGLTAIRTAGWPEQLLTNLYLGIFAVTLVSTACLLQRSTRRTARPAAPENGHARAC